MKRSSRPRREQPKLNMEPPQETEEQFSLEEILNEFGGWSRPQEPEPGQDHEMPGVEEIPVTAMLETPPAVEPGEEGAPLPEGPERPTNPLAASVGTQAGMPEAESDDNPARRPSRFQFIRLEPSMERMLDDEEPEDKPKETPEETPEGPEKLLWAYRPDQQEAPPVPKRPRPAPAVRPKPEAKVIRATRRERKERPAQSAKPDPAYPSVEEAYRTAGKRTRSLVLRRRLVGLICLLAIAVTVLGNLHANVGTFTFTDRVTSQILLGLLLAGLLAAYDVAVNGVYQALRLKANLDTLLFVESAVFLLDGFLALKQGKIPYSAAALLGLYYALWGRVLENRARRRSLKAVLGMEETPPAAVLSRRAWGSHDCVFRAAGEREKYVADLEVPDGAERIMELYAPLALCLTLVLALLFHFLKERSFLWCWSAMLAGSVPVAAFIAYWRPFAALSGKLLHLGGALCGWQGARQLTGKLCVAVEDSDLFSKSNVAMNGMKVFGEYNVSQVVGYTYAVIAESGSGLEPVFHDVFVNQNGRSFVIGNFRRYEGGGVGAEIQGDVILVGSIGFMQLMGVRMPEGTNVRQAVYCAVNQELAAVFAINYNPAAAVKSGLHTVVRNKGLTLLLATRDFILTPAMVRHKFKIPSDSMEYPSAEERARLSGPYAEAGGLPSALLSRDSFLPMAETVTGARALCHSVFAALGVNLLGGVLGIVITAILSYLGAFTAASAFNLMLFLLLWTIPALLLTSTGGKS